MSVGWSCVDAEGFSLSSDDKFQFCKLSCEEEKKMLTTVNKRLFLARKVAKRKVFVLGQ